MGSNPLKQLAGQTAVYGVSSIIGRLVNYLLVPLHTYNFITAEYGAVSNMYAFAAILLVVLTYGLETAFFRFYNTTGKDPAVYSTAFLSILVSTFIIVACLIPVRQLIALVLNVPDHPEFVVWFAIIVGLDAIAAIPFARLRAVNRARQFATLKLVNIGINLVLNLFFIYAVPWLSEHGSSTVQSVVSLFYQGKLLIAYIFVSNLIASVIQLAIFVPGILRNRLTFNAPLWRKMMTYALPLLLLSVAGTINQTIDRLLLTWMLPRESSMEQVGIYSACFKIPIIMYFFLQAFRYAAEPFFFTRNNPEEAKKIYPEVMNAFVIISCLVFLGTMFYLDDLFIYFVDASYRQGSTIVPVVLLAFVFQGISFNLSMWYKLTQRTIFGAWLALIGTAVIILVNVLGIPRYGFMAPAVAFLLSNIVVTVLSWQYGQKYFPVPYKGGRILLYLMLAVGIWWCIGILPLQNIVLRLTVRTIVLMLATLLYLRIEGWSPTRLMAALFRKNT
ncbi:MAG TPA: oligosaccharide flippase family protein [Bacteroidales bacterium]|nr:oligosaccharide flippase family protein [Bacteroidales bacterium]HRZ50234.1 oligosaccharide flippase family protein [Bacteroidales bacterium]